ncbi:MAG TPA: Sua5/YciO/YrdC/YwlC family protein [Tepidisphaeraceae bacterium]|nr:Sua5/YciO/YrdC/YwlC family protein [Tepidisphaeraceae bacterium]
MPVPRVQVVQEDDPVLREAGVLLAGGGVVVLPTETVYGAAARIDVPAGLARLQQLRNGDASKPLTLHLADPTDAQMFVDELTAYARRAIRKLWPGPVGIVLDVTESRAREVAARWGVEANVLFDGNTITLRCPDQPIARQVIAGAGGPVALTRSPAGSTSIEPGAADQLDGQVDLLLDAGPTRFNRPSTLIHLRGDRYDIVREGVYDARIIDRMLKTTVLFVCSGNTCRSPMAESIARQILRDKLGGDDAALEKHGVTVMSAGTFALPGGRATPQAVEAVRGIGADLERHRSRPLSVELIHSADYIYAMGRSHAAAIQALVPSASGKLLTLDPDGDIDDPIGGDHALYRSLAERMRGLIEHRLAEGILRQERS